MLNCVNCSASVTEEEKRCPVCGRNPRVKVVSLDDAPPPSRSPEPPRSQPVPLWLKALVLALGLLVAFGLFQFVGQVTEESDDEKPRTLTSSDGTIALVVPSTWRETSLVPGAEVEASDSNASRYVAAMSAPLGRRTRGLDMSSILELMSKNILRRFDKNAELVGDPEELRVSERPAIQQRVTGTIDGLEIVMLLTVVEADDEVVFVFGWSSPASFLKARPEFDEILQRMRISVDPPTA